MMKINRRTDYAFRVMLALAKTPEGTRLSTHKIQEMMFIPRAFLLRIIADLSKAGMIHTFPGPKGGVQLSRSAGLISLYHVWDAINGPLIISDCVENLKDCPLGEECPVNRHFTKLQEMIRRELNEVTFSILAEEASALTIEE
jgi:Rrf2 family protein